MVGAQLPPGEQENQDINKLSPISTVQESFTFYCKVCLGGKLSTYRWNVSPALSTLCVLSSPTPHSLPPAPPQPPIHPWNRVDEMLFWSYSNRTSTSVLNLSQHKESSHRLNNQLKCALSLSHIHTHAHTRVHTHLTVLESELPLDSNKGRICVFLWFECSF